MKALLIKDILELKTLKKNLILSIVLYAVIIGMNAKTTDIFFISTIMVMFLFSTYAISTFSYDEKNKSNIYMLTLPIGKKDIVLSKYILSISFTIIGGLIGLVLSIILNYILNAGLIDFELASSYLLGGLFGIGLMQSIQIPSMFKYGAEKGRLQMYIAMMIIMVIIGLVAIINPKIDFSFLDRIDFLVPIIFIIFIIGMYYISYKVSINIYNKKEL